MVYASAMLVHHIVVVSLCLWREWVVSAA